MPKELTLPARRFALFVDQVVKTKARTRFGDEWTQDAICDAVDVSRQYPGKLLSEKYPKNVAIGAEIINILYKKYKLDPHYFFDTDVEGDPDFTDYLIEDGKRSPIRMMNIGKDFIRDYSGNK